MKYHKQNQKTNDKLGGEICDIQHRWRADISNMKRNEENMNKNPAEK